MHTTATAANTFPSFDVFALVGEDAPEVVRQTEVVAIQHGHRQIAATVYWRGGEVILAMECWGGESFETARDLLVRALRDALRSCPAVNGILATGPVFTAGEGFARRIARALAAGNASIA